MENKCSNGVLLLGHEKWISFVQDDRNFDIFSMKGVSIKQYSFSFLIILQFRGKDTFRSRIRRVVRLNFFRNETYPFSLLIIPKIRGKRTFRSG